MTTLLKQAFEKASSLPEDIQDTLAAMILEELKDEKRWKKSFAVSRNQLSMLAGEAKTEYRARKTKPLKL